ncbi:MAG: metalloregulator ArsR/SmtB family transcription factor [Cycloclasticus sp.]|jgi:ArsR family transcriptional regulator|nr:MAG: ArsR family transcriptional regulator [Cycloclasticus sp. Phe_18]MBV1912554.1 metalloregulator ArsR/SmtB family transcription factor [Cycloclasticus sp.]MDF1688466.1 metalloregulator ArsR/SmtB family transcription factor [Cycloclasticus sp.]MEE4291625.1 metalloregulator ArsR/SmtB family transcription factor [Cycloclasticus sp.]
MSNQAVNTLISCDSEINKAAELLKVLSHPIRLKIICELGHDEKTVQQLINLVGSTQSNVSQHLAIMRNNGVLQHRKNATQVLYSVAEKAAIHLVQLLKKIYC